MTDDARPRLRPGVNAAAGDGKSPALDQAFDGDSLYALRAAVAAHGSQAGLSEGRTSDLVLAVHELAANAVRHGAGQGRLRLWAALDAVRCEVTDEGAPGEADTADAERWQAEPGHGLWLVRRIADSASVQSGASGTVAAVIFRRVRS
jgi:anti-sigma regulatory factor (Ser/Thr protein kinase)